MALLHDPVGRVGSLWGALEQEDEHHQHHRSSPLRNKRKELHSSALGLCASPPRAVHRTAESVEREKRPTFVTARRGLESGFSSERARARILPVACSFVFGHLSFVVQVHQRVQDGWLGRGFGGGIGGEEV